MKVQEIKKLIALMEALEGAETTTQTASDGPTGQHLVVLDRGFVYVGNCTFSGEWLTLDGAKNLRKWGTTQGLGELRDRPLSDTKCDSVGVVVIPKKAILHLIPCKGF